MGASLQLSQVEEAMLVHSLQLRKPSLREMMWHRQRWSAVPHLPLLNSGYFSLCASPALVDIKKAFNKHESYFYIQGLKYSLEGWQLLRFQTNIKSYKYL